MKKKKKKLQFYTNAYKDPFAIKSYDRMKFVFTNSQTQYSLDLEMLVEPNQSLGFKNLAGRQQSQQKLKLQ